MFLFYMLSARIVKQINPYRIRPLLAATRGLIDLIERPRTTLVDRIVTQGHIRVRESVAKLK